MLCIYKCNIFFTLHDCSNKTYLGSGLEVCLGLGLKCNEKYLYENAIILFYYLPYYTVMRTYFCFTSEWNPGDSKPFHTLV